MKEEILTAKTEYDSSKDTLLHIKRVNELLGMAAKELIRRGNIHDNSKLESPEKEKFDELTYLLKSLTYGTREYKESLKELGIALEHHYKHNSHHPQHYENGVDLSNGGTITTSGNTQNYTVYNLELN